MSTQLSQFRANASSEGSLTDDVMGQLPLFRPPACLMATQTQVSDEAQASAGLLICRLAASLGELAIELIGTNRLGPSWQSICQPIILGSLGYTRVSAGYHPCEPPNVGNSQGEQA